jgi:hypothetical protein
VRGHLAEQVGLIGERPQVRHAVAAVDQHRREIAEHSAGVVHGAAAVELREPGGEAVDEAQAGGEFGNQRGP